MEEARIGENPPRRRPENQTAAAQPPPTQKCPRCNSPNTKFCYYNNYSLSQPRYFCKACRRYWTHGGTLRNVPVGGGCRKSKRPNPKPSPATNPCGGEIPARSQPFSAAPSLGAGVNPGRAPVMPHVGHNNNNSSSSSFYSGGAFLSSLTSMQPLLPGGGNIQGQYDANMALLQNLQSMKQNDQIFQSQSINPVRPGLGSWTQSFIRGSAGPSSSFWSPDVGYHQSGSNSFNPNQWQDINNNNSPGFDPSR